MSEKLGRKIWEFFVKLNLEKTLCEYLALESWDKVVGETLSSHTRPRYVKNGVLYVDTDSSIWVQELNFLKSKIIEDLNKYVNYPAIKDIVFLDKGTTFKKKMAKRSKKSYLKLSLQEEKRIDKIVEVIKDEELKEIFKDYLKGLIFLKKGGKDGGT